MSAHHYLACDLGAESGRVMLGTLEGGKLALEEIHRFASTGMLVRGTRRWDVAAIFRELMAGVQKVAQRGLKPAGISCDSWGVDYVLLRGEEPLITLPYQYRDSRNDASFERTFPVVPREEVFAHTGIQFMGFNTIYQLHADRLLRPDILGLADGFLLIGDYINYLFSGRRAAEASLASTTQLYNPATHAWSQELIKKLDLPPGIFPEIVPSATVLGDLDPALAAELNLDGLKVIATCSHDTGSAVAAAPGQGDDWAYLSSGTWSLLGAELPAPVINDATREANFTNEVGYGGSIRFLKNIFGLWILQECRRAWAAAGQELSYAEITQLAEAAPPLVSLFNPDWAELGKPGDMPAKIERYCRATGQPVPAGPGAMARAVLESLACLYGVTLRNLDKLTGRTTRRLHIIGGGGRNALLNQATADATGVTVLAGPVEGTAIGNLLLQAIALGHVGSHEEARGIIRDSFPLATFEPRDAATWKDIGERFAKLPVEI